MTDRLTVCLAATVPTWLKGELDDRFRLVAPGAADVDAQVLVTSYGTGADAAMIDRFPQLGLIAVFGVGYDPVDVAHAHDRGIAVTNTPDVLTDDVADLAIALVLATLRRVAANDRYVRDGRWGVAPMPPLARSATGRRYGILGLGRIGTAIARRLEAFSPHIAYHNRRPVADSPYRYIDSAVDLARQVEVLVVATPGGGDTEALVGHDVLAALGTEGVVVNIARGSVVDQQALVSALVDGRIAGAGLDVFADEPNVPHELFALEQVVLQPHQASATEESRHAMAELVLANVVAFAEGRALPTAV